jgi:putative hydrolase of the HAD superfamily
VEGGFRAAARFLAVRRGIDGEESLAEMRGILGRDGRGTVFDTLLRNRGAHSEDLVRALVCVYRAHRPSIRLYPDVAPLFSTLRGSGILLALVTDGMGSVQRGKIAALGLVSLLDAIVCTDEIGREHWKPSPVPFRIACELLGVEAREAAYVGDDPSKDFAAPNALGMLTVQVVRPGAPARGRGDAGARARHVVGGLGEVAPLVIGGGHGD